MLIQFTKETSGPATGGCLPGRSHMRGDGGITPRNSYCLVPSISVGQRGGRLSESSPASRHPAAYSGSHLTVQGERPSHPFIQFSRDIACFSAFSLFGIALGVVAAIVWALVSGPK